MGLNRMSDRIPLPAAPRLMGFDVPPLEKRVSHQRHEAIVATLDVIPSVEWVALFQEKIERLKGDLDLAGVTIKGAEISFFGSVGDARRLADKVTALMHEVTICLMRDL